VVGDSNFDNPILEVSRPCWHVLSLLKGVDRAHMKRYVILAVLKMGGKAILLVTIIGVIIGIVGYVNQWNSSLTYSNAFFLAGCLVIIAGTSSRLGAGDDWNTFQLLPGESFGNMSSGERAKFIIEASSSVSLVILGVLTGSFLIFISWLVTKIF
jgi:hypothetical protein